MNFDVSSVITIVGVIAVALICYSMKKYIKTYLDDKKVSEKEEVSKVASVMSETADAFEATLKKAFNEAIDDGVITKDEALQIVSDSLTAIKVQFIKSMTDEINGKRAELADKLSSKIEE